MLIAVVFPMTVLLYCLSAFNLNREQLAINVQVFSPGRYERAARVIADPVQTSIIGQSLKSLRIWRCAFASTTRS